jgi:hypothetical protein
MPAWFDVVREGSVWVVRSQSAECGRFRTQMEAFGMAVLEARKVKESGHSAQVRVVRNEGQPGTMFLSML